MLYRGNLDYFSDSVPIPELHMNSKNNKIQKYSNIQRLIDTPDWLTDSERHSEKERKKDRINSKHRMIERKKMYIRKN